MVSIAVTGASGAVGSRVVERLVASPVTDRVIALDRLAGASSSDDGMDVHRLDLLTDDLAPTLAGCDTIIHLAEDGTRRTDPSVASRLLDRVLLAAEQVDCNHLVLLSSALVYGAHADNPVPLTEEHPVRPVTGLTYAMIKADLERLAAGWADRTGGSVAILRPAATLSEAGSSWIGAALRAAAAVRPEQVDPPVQFLHHDDLVDAVVLSAEARLRSVYNVAPDGWIGSETFRALRGEADVRLPLKLSQWRLRAAKALANRTLLDGLEPYVQWPWVVANDKLRSSGWSPRFSNEEAYVAGTTSPILATIPPQRRQEVALGAVTAAGAAAVAAALWAARRFVR